MDLPRFRGQLRSWDQATASDVILSSCSWSFFSFVPSFCSAPAEPILPSRPAHRNHRRAEWLSRSRTSRARQGLALMATSTGGNIRVRRGLEYSIRTVDEKHGASTSFFNRCTWFLIPPSFCRDGCCTAARSAGAPSHRLAVVAEQYRQRTDTR